MPRPGRGDLPRLSTRTRRWDQAGCIAVPSDDQLNSVPSIHIRCRMMASFRATATRALLRLLRFAMRMPQALRADHLATLAQQHIGGYIEVAPQQAVAAFRDPA